ncbi:MAG: hypothetical protein Q9221_000753 [Calogaya cf. arnoldii]
MGRLDGDGSVVSRVYQAYLHASTFFILPDPLTGYLGLESSVNILKEQVYRCCKPLTSAEISMLNLIASLTPRRTFYPAHGKTMQQVTWHKDMSSLVQNGAFWDIAQKILAHSEQFIESYRDLEPVLPLESRGDEHLLQRAKVRQSAFLNVDYGGHVRTAEHDKDYDARDLTRDSEAYSESIACHRTLIHGQETWSSLQIWRHFGHFGEQSLVSVALSTSSKRKHISAAERRQENAAYKRLSLANVETAVGFYNSQWPCRQPAQLSKPSVKWLNIAAIKQCSEDLFAEWFKNRECQRHLATIRPVIESTMTSPIAFPFAKSTWRLTVVAPRLECSELLPNVPCLMETRYPDAPGLPFVLRDQQHVEALEMNSILRLLFTGFGAKSEKKKQLLRFRYRTDLIATCMRLRQLGQGQSLMYVASPESHHNNVETTSASPTAELTGRNVIEWALEQSCLQIERNQSLRVVRGLSYYQRQQALEALEQPLLAPENDESIPVNDLGNANIEHEAQSLHDLYAPVAMRDEKESDLVKISRSKSDQAVQELIDMWDHIDPSASRHANMHEELERESTNRLLKTAPWQGLYVTSDFVRAIQVKTTTGSEIAVNDDYLRPVHWLLVSKSTTARGVILIISQYEVNECLDLIHAPSSRVTLISYEPRVTRSMPSLESSPIKCLPGAGWDTIPQTLRQELHLFAGQLCFTTYEEYQLLLKALEAEDSISLSFLREWIGIRRRGQNYLQTHVGQVISGRGLHKDMFETSDEDTVMAEDE